MSVFKEVNRSLAALPGNFTNILIIGGSYAGLSFIKNFISQLSASQNGNILPLQPRRKFSITMIEPRSGFLNVIGLPRAIVDTGFAATQYISYDQLNSIKFNNTFKNEKNISTYEAAENKKIGFELNHIQGTVTKMGLNSIEYVMNERPQVSSLGFDYAVLASGRHRGPPVTPMSCDKHSFINEMSEFRKNVEQNDPISVIGAGAVGIEIAANIKQYYPEKTVNLIHPHSLFPPEPLSDEFKNLVHKSLKDSGVNIFPETRIAKELLNGNLISTDGKTIESQFNYWSNDKKNNISMLSNDIKDKYVSEQGNMLVNEYLQLSNSSETVQNVFCVGDIVDLPVIKTAGWANGMGEICAANVFRLLCNEKAAKTIPQEYLSFKSMVLVTGNEDLISEVNGQVEINNPTLVEEYKDYCMSKVRIELDL